MYNGGVSGERDVAKEEMARAIQHNLTKQIQFRIQHLQQVAI